MDTLIVYPENKEQLTALKASNKRNENHFGTKSEVIPEAVKEGIKESLQQANSGDLIPYNGISEMTGK